MSIVGTRPPLISETNLYELHHRAREILVTTPTNVYPKFSVESGFGFFAAGDLYPKKGKAV